MTAFFELLRTLFGKALRQLARVAPVIGQSRILDWFRLIHIE
jgi:hypothetical protein